MVKELPRYLKKETEEAPTFFEGDKGPKEAEREKKENKINDAITNWDAPLETEEPEKPKNTEEKP